MKNDEYINEEFEINPSNKAIEEILPEDNTDNFGGSDMINTGDESIIADAPEKEETGYFENIDADFSPKDEDTLNSYENSASLYDGEVLEAEDASEYIADEESSSEQDAVAYESPSAEDGAVDEDAHTLFPPLTDDEEMSEETNLSNGEPFEGTDNKDAEMPEDDLDDRENDDGNFEVNEAQYDSEGKKNPENQTAAEKPRRVDSLFDFIELFVFTLAAVFIITSFFFRYSIVDGGSMQNTLQNDEKLILRSIFYSPQCGDVVVVQDKSTILKDPIVKRVIAVGGQTVRFTRDAVYVDGIKLDEPYVYTDDYQNPFGGEDIYRYSVYPSDALEHLVTDIENGVFYEITVPEGEIFVMGDHRNNSRDSREIGTLHEDAIIGKVVLRFFPFSEFGKIE